jgi:hypothetical protein
VATYSTGISVTFDGTVITNPFSLSWTYGSGIPRGRSSVWTDNLGSVTVESYVAIATSQYGKRANIVITEGGMSLTQMAICTDVSATAELGGVTRYSATFQLTDNA